MATLQKFELFATQCAAVNIPTQSPTKSPLLLHRRHRRKTLRMLLTRRPQIPDSDHHQSTKQSSNSPPSSATTASDASSIHRRLKLKDLFFSSSTSPTNHFRGDRDRKEAADKVCDEIGSVRSDREIIKPKAVRPVYQPFRCRSRLLLRKAWRPVLGTIDETQV